LEPTGDRRAGNYANISPLMDLAFGTYRCPDREPESFGIGETVPRSYLGQMLYPIVGLRLRRTRLPVSLPERTADQTAQPA